jgi:microcystin-dependent protein
MPYNITLSNGDDLIAGGLLDNTADSANTSLVLVGKNYKGYGLFLNQNFARLMENFAKSTAPAAPLPGQVWYNSTTKRLNVNISATKGTLDANWKGIAGLTLSATTPATQYTGELWYDSTNGQLKIYTGTEWRLVGPLSRLVTGNTGAIPDTVTDAPPANTYVILKFFIDNVLVGIWSKEEDFASDVPGFATIRKGLNFNSTLSHKFWGTASVADNIFVGATPTPGTSFLRNDQSGTTTGSLGILNDTGLSVGVANDFNANVTSGTVTLRNVTNNRDLILSLRVGGLQTPFLRGNNQTGLAEVYNHPTASSPALTVATKNYVDRVTGAVTGIANFFSEITPNANVAYTLGNTTNRWSNIFSQDILVGNVYAANTFATTSNVAQIYLGADIVPTANISSNIGSAGMRIRTLNANTASLTGELLVGLTAAVGGNITVTGNSTVGANLTVTGNAIVSAATPSTSTASGAVTIAGGVGVAGNLNVGGTIVTPTMPAGTSNTAVATTAFVVQNSIPTGGIMMWSTASAPTGFLLCNGSAISRTAYAALFAVIGTTFGVGDNSTTFNLPDYNNRTPVGAGGLYALGATGGSKDATVVSHTHTATSVVTDPGHRHTWGFGTEIDDQGSGSSAREYTRAAGSDTTVIQTATTGISVATTVASAGSSGTDANMQPYLAMQFIIKT